MLSGLCLQPDELVTAGLLRSARAYGLAVKTLGRLVFGREGWRPSFLGIPPLTPVAEMFRLSKHDILWNHTQWPYMTATTTSASYEGANAAVLGEASLTRLGSLLRFASDGVPNRRFCAQCVQSELKALGFSYWHRSHNLPGVWVCCVHGIYLEESDVELSGADAASLCMPHECQGRRLGRRARPTPVHLRISEISRAWLHRPRTANEVPSPSTYRSLAEKNGWVTPQRRLDTSALLAEIRVGCGLGFLTSADAMITGTRASWPIRMLRPGSPVQCDPVKHAILLALLGQPRPVTASTMDHRPAGAEASPSEMLDAFYAKVAASELRLVLSQRQVLTTDNFLRRVGCLSHYRRRRVELPLLSTVVREFRSSAATVKRLKPGKQLFRSDGVSCAVAADLP